MRCISCHTENKSDAAYCRVCGNDIRKCISCDALIEADALYCDKCGKLTGALSESRVAEASGHGEPSRANASGAKSGKKAEREVIFKTNVSPRRVELISSVPSRGTRVAFFVAAVLVVGGVLTSVFMMWLNTRAIQVQLARLPAEHRAELDEMRNLIAETIDVERRAVYEQINQFVTQRLDEQRKSIMVEYKQFVNQRLEEERRIFAQAQKQDYTTLIAVLTDFRSKTKNGPLRSEIDRLIAVYKGRIAGNGQRESAAYKGRTKRSQQSRLLLAD